MDFGQPQPTYTQYTIKKTDVKPTKIKMFLLNSAPLKKPFITLMNNNVHCESISRVGNRDVFIPRQISSENHSWVKTLILEHKVANLKSVLLLSVAT